MISTSVSLLDKVRRPEEHAAWGRFVEIYTPVLLAWAGRLGLQGADAADLVQDVFVLLVRKLPTFAYDRDGSFRGWLRTVALNEWRSRRKLRPGPLGEIDVAAPAEEAFWEADYRQHLARRALLVMQNEFETTTWQACWETVVNGLSAPEAAAKLGMRPGAVRAAKFRVLTRLRQELDGLMD